jgi:hypothetical protein
VRLLALREPIPLFEHSSEVLFSTGSFNDSTYADDLTDEHTRFLWGDSTPDDILSGATGAFASALADSLWGAYHSFVATPLEQPGTAP